MHLSILLLPTVVATLVSAEHHGSKKIHAIVGANKREETGLSVFKRGDDAQFTFYKDGLGACGKSNDPSDLIVALNSQDYDGGSHCFDMITITVGDTSSEAMIVDECMGCGPNNLDLSEGLFNILGSESAGVLHGSWSYGGGDTKASPSPSPKAKAKASPSHTTTHSSKSSSKVKPTSTKAKPSSSTIKHVATHTPSATSSSVTPNMNVQTVGALPSQEAGTSNIYAINMAFLGLSGLVAST